MMKRKMPASAVICMLLLTTLSGCASKTESLSESTAGSSKDLDLHVLTQPEVESPEWVTALPAAQDENTSQLFVVAAMGMDKTTASISMHERDKDGNWKQVLSTPGFVGEEGSVKMRITRKVTAAILPSALMALIRHSALPTIRAAPVLITLRSMKTHTGRGTTARACITTRW